MNLDRFHPDLAGFIERVAPRLNDESLTLAVESMDALASRSEFIDAYLGHRAFMLGCEDGARRNEPGSWVRIGAAIDDILSDATTLGSSRMAYMRNDLLGAYQDGYNTNLHCGDTAVRFL